MLVGRSATSQFYGPRPRSFDEPGIEEVEFYVTVTPFDDESLENSVEVFLNLAQRYVEAVEHPVPALIIACRYQPSPVVAKQQFRSLFENLAALRHDKGRDPNSGYQALRLDLLR